MRAAIQNDRLILEGEEDGHQIKCETILGEKDLRKIKENPDFVQEFLYAEREWKISYPNGESRSYIRLGKLSEGNDMNCGSSGTGKKKEPRKN